MRPLLLRRRCIAGLAALALLAFVPAAAVSAHSDLESASPAEGATVPSPFAGPVLLTFTEELADGSMADLVGPAGKVATADVDPDGPTMTVNPAEALAPGDYRVEWTSIAGDGDLLRGIVTFTVAAPAATPSPEPSPSPSPSATATAAPTASASAAATATAAPTAAAATPAPTAPADTAGGADVILPIVVVLIVVAAGAFYLVRRNRPA
jgi:hypothetical protein